MRLSQLQPDTRFQLDDRTGTLLMVNECLARVRWDGPAKLVEFEVQGKRRAFVSDTGRATDIAPGVDVQVIP